MSTRPCAGPTPGMPCPTRQLVTAKPGSKTAARCMGCRRRYEQQRGTSSQRGYGTQHQRLRATLLATYHPGDPCPRCGLPLGNNPSKLDLGHTDTRRGYRGLEHATCNRAAH